MLSRFAIRRGNNIVESPQYLLRVVHGGSRHMVFFRFRGRPFGLYAKGQVRNAHQFVRRGSFQFSHRSPYSTSALLLTAEWEWNTLVRFVFSVVPCDYFLRTLFRGPNSFFLILRPNSTRAVHRIVRGEGQR